MSGRERGGSPLRWDVSILIFIYPAFRRTSFFLRIMRLTGKYWLLIIIAGLSAVVSTTLMSFWGANTSSYHLWLDILPWGLAVAAGGNGKLIVSLLILSAIRLLMWL